MSASTFADAGFAIPPRPQRARPIPLRLQGPLLAWPWAELAPLQQASLRGMLLLGLAWGGAELAFWLTAG